MYLPLACDKAILRQLRGSLKRFQVSFDYFACAMIGLRTGVPGLTRMAVNFKSMNAPWITGFDDIAALAAEMDLCVIEDARASCIAPTGRERRSQCSGPSIPSARWPRGIRDTGIFPSDRANPLEFCHDGGPPTEGSTFFQHSGTIDDAAQPDLGRTVFRARVAACGPECPRRPPRTRSTPASTRRSTVLQQGRGRARTRAEVRRHPRLPFDRQGRLRIRRRVWRRRSAATRRARLGCLLQHRSRPRSASSSACSRAPSSSCS